MFLAKKKHPEISINMKKFILFSFSILLFTHCGSSKDTSKESAQETQSQSSQPSNSQDITTVTAKSEDISDNLDLEAVAAVFGESKDLEDFEKRLNDPESKISNLDLNEDGEVDYLRVVENSEKDLHVISIQAVIGKDQFQDVATIDVEKNSKGETSVQVVGDVYMYGTNYIITPVYVAPPPMYVWFWGPMYSPYYSPYYWHYYPPYYNPWRTVAIHHYRTHAYAHAHHHHHHSYHHTTVRVSHRSVNVQNKNKRNDLARTQPNKSFDKRNKGVTNKQGLNNQAAKTNRSGATTTGRKTNNNWQSSSNGRVHKSTRPTSPSSGPSTRPSTPSRNPSTRPSNPSSRPSTKPSNPSSRPSSRPSYNRPSTRSYSSPSRSMGGRRR